MRRAADAAAAAAAAGGEGGGAAEAGAARAAAEAAESLTLAEDRKLEVIAFESGRELMEAMRQRHGPLAQARDGGRLLFHILLFATLPLTGNIAANRQHCC